jgi:hypothetical protein
LALLPYWGQAYITLQISWDSTGVHGGGSQGLLYFNPDFGSNVKEFHNLRSIPAIFFDILMNLKDSGRIQFIKSMVI